jgi:hypothetical protein
LVEPRGGAGAEHDAVLLRTVGETRQTRPSVQGWICRPYIACPFGVDTGDAHGVLPRRKSGDLDFYVLGRTLCATAGAGLHETGGILHKTGKMISGGRTTA